MAIRWQTLTLSGFGCYREPVEIGFGQGFSVGIADNETGKSTLGAGITAIIFGLPASADPRVFGQARYRNWHGSSRFEGVVTFSAGESVYRIHRNFENHRVSLQLRSDSGWQEVAAGEHNPSARKPNRVYEDRLAELFGIKSRELFFASFFIGQPLPEAETILPELQRLLSGAGTHYRQALQALEEQAKAITRHTGRLGITQQDMRQDRELEQLAAELAGMEQEVRESSRLLTELQETTAALALSRDSLAGKAGELAEKEQMLEAWGQWRVYRDRYDDSLLRQSGLKAALEQTLALQASLREKERRLAAEFAHCANLPAHTGEALSALQRLQSRRQHLDTEQEQALQELKAAENALREAEKGLQPYADVRGRHTLLQDCRTLRELAAGEQVRRRRQDASCRRVHELRAQLKDRPAPAGLGALESQRVDAARQAAAAVSQEWQVVEESLALLSEVNNRPGRRLRTGVAALLTGLAAGGGVYLLTQSGPAAGLTAAVLTLLVVLLGHALSAKEVTGSIAEARRIINAFLSRHGGYTDPAAFLAAQPGQLPPPWPLLAGVVAAYSEPVASVADLLACLDTAGEQWWQDAKEAAMCSERLVLELQKAEIELAGFRGDSVPGAAETTHVLAVIEQLRQAVAPFDETTDMEELRCRTEACRQAESNYTAAAAAVKEARRQAEASAARLLALRDEEAPLLNTAAPLLAGGEPLANLNVTWQEAWQCRRQKEQEEKELAAVLRSHNVSSPEMLQAAAADAVNRSVAILRDWEQLIAGHPGLPGISREAADAAALEQVHKRLTDDAVRLRQETDAAHEAVRQLEYTLARLQGKAPVNVAAAAERMQSLRERHGRLSREAAALQGAHSGLTAAIKDYSSSYRLQLAEKASAYLVRFSGVYNRHVQIDPAFTVRVHQDGREVALPQLSQGARDQLYIALRLAIGDLLAADIRLPFIFDDPFLNWDIHRLANIRTVLTDMAKERQVILFSHNPLFAAWGESCEIIDGGGAA